MNLKLSDKTLYSLLAVALLALTAFLFFCPDDIEGNVLQQHDTGITSFLLSLYLFLT